MAERLGRAILPRGGWLAGDIETIAPEAEGAGFEAIFSTEVDNDEGVVGDADVDMLGNVAPAQQEAKALLDKLARTGDRHVPKSGTNVRSLAGPTTHRRWPAMADACDSLRRAVGHAR
jgi:hypothetical protein